MCEYLNEPDWTAIAIFEANERLGAALAYVYRNYPSIRNEVLDYMANEWEPGV